jgi:hypothetical protein
MKDKDEKQRYIWRLQRLPESELRRENNMARNKAMLESMELLHTSTFMGMKKKREVGDEGKRKKKRQKGNEDEWGSSESDDDEEEPATPVRTRSSRGKAQVAGGTQGGGGTGTATPKWATSAKAMLLDTKGVELGEDWADVIDVWWELEQLTKFATSVRRRFGGSNAKR